MSQDGPFQESDPSLGEGASIFFNPTLRGFLLCCETAAHNFFTFFGEIHLFLGPFSPPVSSCFSWLLSFVDGLAIL